MLPSDRTVDSDSWWSSVVVTMAHVRVGGDEAVAAGSKPGAAMHAGGARGSGAVGGPTDAGPDALAPITIVSASGSATRVTVHV